MARLRADDAADGAARHVGKCPAPHRPAERAAAAADGLAKLVVRPLSSVFLTLPHRGSLAADRERRRCGQRDAGDGAERPDPGGGRGLDGRAGGPHAAGRRRANKPSRPGLQARTSPCCPADTLSLACCRRCCSCCVRLALTLAPAVASRASVDGRYLACAPSTKTKYPQPPTPFSCSEAPDRTYP